MKIEEIADGGTMKIKAMVDGTEREVELNEAQLYDVYNAINAMFDLDYLEDYLKSWMFEWEFTEAHRSIIRSAKKEDLTYAFRERYISGDWCHIMRDTLHDYVYEYEHPERSN